MDDRRRATGDGQRSTVGLSEGPEDDLDEEEEEEDWEDEEAG